LPRIRVQLAALIRQQPFPDLSQNAARFHIPILGWGGDREGFTHIAGTNDNH
jgi:hypothetical protein